MERATLKISMFVSKPLRKTEINRSFFAFLFHYRSCSHEFIF
ncbi:hypothetical protein GT23_2464 [Parageobacillus thermoglucosidasius]|nr:hypothetical protein GT23_2464 [Parageobacillus thermoglucosidasius]